MKLISGRYMYLFHNLLKHILDTQSCQGSHVYRTVNLRGFISAFDNVSQTETVFIVSAIGLHTSSQSEWLTGCQGLIGRCSDFERLERLLAHAKSNICPHGANAFTKT